MGPSVKTRTASVGIAYRACMSGTIDWLILTASSRRQAKAFASQVAARADRGALARAGGILVVPDACDRRIGSGSATVLALVQLARQLVARKRGAGSIEELFGGERVMLIHSGGDSRRLPMYAAEGKLFAPIPRPAPGNRCAAVFDLLLDDLLTVEPRKGGEVIVAAGDAVLGLARTKLAIDGAPGVIGLAQAAPLARAIKHGVFVAPRDGGAVQAFMQKPSEKELRDAGAVLRGGDALVDLGVFSFDPRSTAALLAGSGVVLEKGEIRLTPGRLADLASRAEIPAVDLYREIAMALPGPMDRERYLDSCGAGDLKPALGDLYDSLRGTPFSVRTVDLGEFLHIGSMRELLDALCGRRADIRRFGVDAASHPMPVPAKGRGGAPVALDSVVQKAECRGDRAVIDCCVLDEVELGGGNIVCGVRGKRPLRLPRGHALFALPLVDGVSAEVVCGIDDDFKTPLDAGGTFLGAPFARFVKRAGVDPEAILAGDRSLWEARLWTASLDGGCGESVEWMWRGDRAPDGWLDSTRVSLRQLVSMSDSEEIAALREASGRMAAGLAPQLALMHAAVAGDIAEIQREVVSAPSARRREMLAAAPPSVLAGIGDPLARARVAASFACVARDLGKEGARSAARYRELAFAAVGEVVLSRFGLPKRPVRAAILHDQAVWTSMPVRVDLAGGWSDTPPICNAVGGSVVNVAVTLRGQLPVQVVAKLEEEPVIRITSTDLGQTLVIRKTSDLARRNDPARWSSLAENALVLAGLAPSEPGASLAKWLKAVGGGVSLTMFSAVPKGSGLGTSSILGAATIQCLDRMLGRERTPQELFAATSALEQMLGSRGGWQDQVGGVVGGFKIGRTRAGAEQLPAVEAIPVADALARELRSRSVLYFTGERRMAKNILENVVWNFLTNEDDALEAVAGLRSNASRMRGALVRGDVDGFIGELDRYMRLKRQIDPGSAPPMFDALAKRWRGDLASWCFAGAGGGGFMLLVAKDAAAAERLRADIARSPRHPRARAFDFEVDPVGLRCAVL
jgi:fucokinase